MSGRPSSEVDRIAFLLWDDEIERARREHGDVSEIVREAAAAIGVSERTIWRWNRRLPGPRSRASLTAHDFALIRRKGGNRAAAHRLSTAGVSISTYRRAFNALDKATRVGLAKGTKAVRTAQHYFEIKATHRNERWEMDHTLAPIWIVHPHTGRLVRPWMTLVVDCYSGVWVGWAFTFVEKGAADTSSVLAALASAILRYGRPKALVYDQGADFVSDRFTRALGRLQINAVPLPKESPQKKPYVERANRTIKAGFFPDQAGFIVPRSRAA
jgi:transposase InsO family protein